MYWLLCCIFYILSELTISKLKFNTCLNDKNMLPLITSIQIHILLFANTILILLKELRLNSRQYFIYSHDHKPRADVET